MTTPIPVTRQVVPSSDKTVALNTPAEQQPQTFTEMQKKMEDEMDNRRMEWEKEVEKMQQDFFNLTPKDRSKAEKAVDVAVSASKAPIRRHGTEIIDISNTKDLYTTRPDGTKAYRLRFDVREFEPGEIHVKAEGHVLYIQAEHQDEFGDVKKVAKQFSRQMDLPEAVDPDKIEANLSSDGFLTVEAPVDKIPETECPYKPFAIADATAMNNQILESIEKGGGLNGSNRKVTYFEGKTPGGVQVEYDPANEKYSYEHYLSGGGGYGDYGDYGDYPEGYSITSSSEYPVYSRNVEYSMQPGYHVQYSSNHPGGPCPHPWSRCHQIHHHSPENRMKTHQNMKSSPTTISYSSPAVKIQTHTGGPPTMTSELLAMVNNSPKVNAAELESRLENNLSSNISSMISQQPRSDVNLASFGRYTNPLVVIVDGQRKLKLSVDIGQGFSPEEIEVTLKNNKIGIKASHEETVPWSSKRHFSREWDLPEDIESRTLRAMLTESGRIILGASCKSNQNHDAVLESIKNDMPQSGQYCRIKID